MWYGLHGASPAGLGTNPRILAKRPAGDNYGREQDSNKGHVHEIRPLPPELRQKRRIS